jgi:hypothetical protein
VTRGLSLQGTHEFAAEAASGRCAHRLGNPA